MCICAIAYFILDFKGTQFEKILSHFHSGKLGISIAVNRKDPLKYSGGIKPHCHYILARTVACPWPQPQACAAFVFRQIGKQWRGIKNILLLNGAPGFFTVQVIGFVPPGHAPALALGWCGAPELGVLRSSEWYLGVSDESNFGSLGKELSRGHLFRAFQNFLPAHPGRISVCWPCPRGLRPIT